MVLVIRLSAIPSHFSTAVFSTCGVRFLPFAIATFLTLPKQIFLVYLGVLLLQDKHDSSAKNAAFAIAFLLTLVMAGYIWYSMRAIKRVLLAEQAARRKAALEVDAAARGAGEEPGQVETQPRRGSEYQAVGQDDGVVDEPDRAATPAHATLGLRYRPEEYQGAAGADDVGREPVRERMWV